MSTKLSEKDRIHRSKVRMKMVKLRTQLKELLQEEGQQSDIDSCNGEIEVLRKELQSLEDGGHTTFIKAKQMLEPKKNLSTKGKKIDTKVKFLKIRLKNAEKKLNEQDSSPKLKEKQQEIVEDLKEQLQSLSGERQAIENFNHTRFVQLKSQASEGDKQTEELTKVEEKIRGLQLKLLKCANSENEAHLKDELHFLEMEKESIENFTHDHFLENVESMKVKRRSELR
jgi:hypothetical protein